MIERTTWKCEKCNIDVDIIKFTGKYGYCNICQSKLVPLVWLLKSEHEEEIKKVVDNGYVVTKLNVKLETELRELKIKHSEELVRIKKEIKKKLGVYPSMFTDRLIDDVFGGGVATDKVKGTLSVSGDQHNNDTEKLGEGSIPSVPISVAPQNQIKGNGLDTCIKCGVKRKRFGGASFYYPERESGLCSNCFGGVRR